MDRLTHTNKGMAWYKSDLLLLEPCELSYSQVGEVLRRLAAYEDTGLKPEDLKVIANTTGGMLMKLMKAYDEGRLLQYAPGDTVYDRFGVAWTVAAAEIHKFSDGQLRHLYRCGHPGTDDYCALYSDEISQKPEV
jgi:hypothetical protein